MKKFLTFVFVILCTLFVASVSFADQGSCDKGEIDGNGVITYSWDLIDEDSNGIVTGSYCPIVSGWVYGIRLIPDDTANLVISGDYQPTDDWDAEIEDQYGYDILDGIGADVTNVFTDTRQYRTPTTTDQYDNNVGHLYLSGVKLRGYAANIGNNNGVRIEISIKVQDAVRKGR